ncbi:MAG TPA: protein kinase [Thermoanaerobaculia bacterium]|nr:protein kinase [Thermoanaerobaculia bacterium]
MTVSTGTRLGPYEILAPLGAGGMGEVFRARDPRLGRDVAIKVLAREASESPERRLRFEKEARAASALNHPSIVSIYDIGTAEGTTYIAMELVDGATLRDSLSGATTAKRLLDIACPIADGLAKAHAAGIVHRDLKPENVMISKDGFVKILDFGLAKLAETEERNVSEIPTGTTPGMVMGTVGYMAPEQATGKPVDFRCDQFSLGTILYELASGKRAFRRETSAETLVAIIRDEPEPLGQLSPKLPPPLRWIIERCLSKDPEQRYASTRDLARDLAMLREHLPEATSSGEMHAPALEEGEAAPSFQRLSFQRGTILSARFAPDGRTVIYGASWDGNPTKLYSTRPESPESSALMLPDAEILAISANGMMAISLERHWSGRFIWSGTLAQVSMLGGAPREILEDVQWADWSPDGSALAIVRNVSGKIRVEYPIGNVLYETAGWISHPRVSPDGTLVAFLVHPVHGNDMGSVCAVDRNGKLRELTSDWVTTYGLAWSKNGREIWYTATRAGVARTIWAVSLAGETRMLLRTPGELTIHDISKDGGVLVTSDNGKVGIVGLPPGQEKERDLSLLDWSRVCDLSADGKTVLFDESGEGSGAAGGVFVRKTDGSPAVRLGDGRAGAFSPDGKWVISQSQLPPHNARLLPVKAGTPRELHHSGLATHAARWLPDGHHVLLLANEPNAGLRLFVQSVDGGEPRAVTPEGTGVGFFPVSPDGKFVVAQGADHQFALYPLDGGDPQPLPTLTPDDRPIRWTPMGNSLYVFRRGDLPSTVMQLDLATGRKERVLDLMPPDPAGIVEIVSVQLTPDAASYAYSYHRILSDLLLVGGLK